MCSSMYRKIDLPMWYRRRRKRTLRSSSHASRTPRDDVSACRVYARCSSIPEAGTRRCSRLPMVNRHSGASSAGCERTLNGRLPNLCLVATISGDRGAASNFVPRPLVLDSHDVNLTDGSEPQLYTAEDFIPYHRVDLKSESPPSFPKSSSLGPTARPETPRTLRRRSMEMDPSSLFTRVG